MKRILLMVLRNIVFVPYWWIKLCWYAAHTDDYPEEKKYAFLRLVDEHAIEGGNIHIDVHGQENIPKENGFMFFPNHQGLFDVLAIIKACPVPFSVVAKKEVGDIPFLKQVFACMKAFIIDREDLKQSMQVIVNDKGLHTGKNLLQKRNLSNFLLGNYRKRNRACPDDRQHIKQSLVIRKKHKPLFFWDIFSSGDQISFFRCP